MDWDSIELTEEDLGVPEEDVSFTSTKWDDIDLSDSFESWEQLPEEPEPLSEQERTSAWRQISYGFDRASSDVESLSKWIESHMPAGRLAWGGEEGLRYESPEEIIGEDVADLTPDERRARLTQFRSEQLTEEYPEFKPGHEENLFTTIGDIGGTLATPTSLIPVGQSLKATAASGAGIGAFYGTSEALADKGEVDFEDVAIPATVGAVASPALIATGRAAISATKRVKDMTTSKSADKVFNTFEESVYDLISNKGMRPKDAVSVTRAELGLSQEALDELANKANRKVYIPTKEEAVIYNDAVKLNDEGSTIASRSVVDQLIKPVSDRVKEISVPAWQRLRKLDYLQHARVHEAHTKVDPFLQGISKLSKEEYRAVSLNLFNGDFNTVEAILKKNNKGLVESFEQVKTVLKDLHKEASESGMDIGFVENYFPRIVKDSDKYLEYLGKEALTSLELAKRKAAKAKGSGLTPEESSHITNVYLRGYNQTLDKGLGLAKERSVKELTSDVMENFYTAPEEALHTYIRKIINETEKRYFFGKNWVKNDLTGKTDITESIGSLVENTGAKDIDLLRDLLTVRFGPGEAVPSEWIRHTKNILYGFTLGNPVSAVTQVGDIFFSGYKNGILPTIKTLASKNKIKLDDYGFTDIAEEFADKSKSAKFLQNMFQWSGFTRVDRLGKETLLNSSLKKYTKEATKNPEAFKKKWGEAFGEEVNDLVSALQQGNHKDSNVRLLLWHDLADLQPVALSEMPEKYLSTPDTRIFYMLKTFTMKQLNIIREDGIKKLKTKGERKEGAKNLAKYSSLFLTAGMSTDAVKSWMLGREYETSDSFVENLWKLGGTNKYMGEKMLEHPATEAAQIIMPPLNVVEDMIMEAANVLQGEEVDKGKLIKQVPLVGRLAYEHMLGGKEKFAEKQSKEQMKELGF